VAGLLELTASCPVPILIAGGPRRTDEAAVLAFAEDALAGGATGVAMGRNIFQSAAPDRLARRIAGLVHDFDSRGLDDLTGELHHDGPQAVLA
jgi:2-amino-4,5-dihydroxy-6-oxo-7-(phosphonooxy)heptanoate synthase